MTNPEPEDYWANLEGRRESTPEEREEILGPESPKNAAWLGRVFLLLLIEDDKEALSRLVTPESTDWWGNFDKAREWLLALDNYGVGSIANRALDARDVAYVKIIEHVTIGFTVSGTEIPVMIPGVVSLVWRPEVGSWLAHRIGDPVHPDEMPRSSPGAAPLDHD